MERMGVIGSFTYIYCGLRGINLFSLKRQDLKQYLNSFKVFGGTEYEIQNQETEWRLSGMPLEQHQNPALLKQFFIFSNQCIIVVLLIYMK